MGSVHRVAIVLRGELGPEIGDLSRRMHVWVVRTSETEEVARRTWGESSLKPVDPLTAGLTLFNSHGSPEQTLLSILNTVELHHGAYSHDPPVTVVEVFGVDVTDAIREAFEAIGFTRIRPTQSGFSAERDASER